MQQELQNLQPELIKTSANTEKLMVKIEQDTVEVEAKREVCATLHTQTNKVWNSLSSGVCVCVIQLAVYSEHFRQDLKTHLFTGHYRWSEHYGVPRYVVVVNA